MLAAVTIDYLLQHVHSVSTPVAFVYCSYAVSKEQDPIYLIASLLRQLLNAV